MLKIIAVTSLLASISTAVIIPSSNSPVALQPVVKTDRIATRTDADVRNFLSPRLNGNRVTFCLVGASQCGKEAANAFCRKNGFEEAITFQRDHVQSKSAQLRFRQIKCWHRRVAAGAKLDATIELTGALVTTNGATKSNRL